MDPAYINEGKKETKLPATCCMRWLLKVFLYEKVVSAKNFCVRVVSKSLRQNLLGETFFHSGGGSRVEVSTLGINY